MGPVRTCVGCRERGLRSDLLRVVVQVDREGAVGVSEGREARAVVDVERSSPGRGAWLHPDLRCLDLAERRRAFPRALRSGPLDTSSVRQTLEASKA